jgi:hypothetical protein
VAVLTLPQFGVLQATCDDPDVRCHHRNDAKYNHVFHLFSRFASLVLNSQIAFSAASSVRHGLEMGAPSGRNCSPRPLPTHELSHLPARYRATSAWLLWFRRLTRELFSSMLLSYDNAIAPSARDSASIGFYFAKIAF